LVVAHGPLWADRLPDAPVVGQGDAPDVLVDAAGRDVLAALANDDRRLALVVEVGAALRGRDVIIRAGHGVRHLPEAPLAALARPPHHLVDGDAAALHASQVLAEVAAGTGDAASRPGGMQ